MTRFHKVEMAADGWGLLVNEGTTEAPRFRVVMKGSREWMESLAADLNAGTTGVLPQRGAKGAKVFTEGNEVNEGETERMGTEGGGRKAENGGVVNSR